MYNTERLQGNLPSEVDKKGTFYHFMYTMYHKVELMFDVARNGYNMYN